MQSRPLWICLTLIIGSLGGLVTISAGISGGWLIGALIAVFVSGAAGLPIFVPGWLRSIAMGFAGITVGASIDAHSISLLAILPWSLIAMALFLTVVVWITYRLHQRLWNANRATALACAWPGNVLLVFAGAETTRAKMDTVYVVQSVRILALMGLLPLTIGLYHEPIIAKPIAISVDLTIAGVLALVCIILSVHIKLVGGEMFLTAMAVGILSGLNILQVAIPPLFNTFFQVVVGSFIGLGLARCGARAFANAFVPSLASAIFFAAATITMAVIMSSVLDYSTAALALAFAPGGAEAMILLTTVFGVDPAFVGIHHTVRLIVLTFCFPIVLRLVSKSDHQATGN